MTAFCLFFGSMAFAQYTPTLGLIAFYPFDGDANDYSGNNNNGTVYGATLTADRFNVANKAYDFDGINDYIQVPGSPSFDLIEQTNMVTITAWINIRAWYQNWSHFMMFERHRASDDNGWGFAILKQPAQCSIFYPQDMALADTIGFQPAFNTWYHVAVSWNKTIDDSARMYINGVKRKTFKVNYSALTSTNNGNVYIGRSIIGIDEYSNGKIDELGVYRRVLTDQEIMNIYLGTPPSTVGIAKNQPGTTQIAAYPNPLSGSLYIETNGKSARYTIADLMGQIVMQGDLTGTATKVDVSCLPEATYLLTVDGNVVGRLVKIVQ